MSMDWRRAALVERFARSVVVGRELVWFPGPVTGRGRLSRGVARRGVYSVL